MGAVAIGLECLECYDRERIGNTVDPLHDFVDEVPGIVFRFYVKLGQQIVLPGDRVNFCDLLYLIHDLAGDLIGLAELTFDENENRFHGLGSAS